MSIRVLSLLCSILLSVSAFAQLPPTRISDEGGAKSVFFNLDCVGGGISCSTSGINATVNVPTGYTSSDFDTDYATELGLPHTWTGLQRFSSIGVGDTTPTGGAGIEMSGTTSSYLGPLLANFTYSGASTVVAALQSEITHSGSGANPVIWGAKLAALATTTTSGIFYTTGLESSVGFADASQVLDPGDIGVMIGANYNIRSSGGAHSPLAWYIAMGAYIPAFPAVTGPGVLVERGIYAEEHIEVAANVRYGFDAGLLSNATTYQVYNSSLAELQTVISGVEIQALKTNAIGWFGATPATRPTAYTQTYSTATRTHSAITYTDISGTTFTKTDPWGFVSDVDADAFRDSVHATANDLANLKQVVNSLIDDLQAYGLLQ